MQQIELALIAAGSLTILVVWFVRSRAHLMDRPNAVGAMLGIVPGILGAVIVLVPRTDLVPDQAEPFIWLIVVVVVGCVAVIAWSTGSARR